ncbi:hypothetical protein [Erythrobacter alti]|uniref:hypothetical protein n=1 Tax=Erythrobacter alti TaxID=1896145 RepID=UPI0030F3F335
MTGTSADWRRSENTKRIAIAFAGIATVACFLLASIHSSSPAEAAASPGTAVNNPADVAKQ